MDKKWFIIVGGKQEGPFTIEELQRHPGVTPDTYVWREGYENWILARCVSELQEVFEDKPEAEPIQDRFKTKKLAVPIKNMEEILTLSHDPFQFFLWLSVAILIILYIHYRINFQ